MKKPAILLSILSLLAIASCSNTHSSSSSSSSTESVTINEVSIILPNGTPALAMGTLLNEVKSEVVSDASLLQTALASKKVDLVIAPLTVGTNLYLKGKSEYKLEAIITTNNTYLVSRGDNKLTKENLQGKEVIGFQETNTPGIIWKTYLEKQEISLKTNYVTNVNMSVTAFKNDSLNSFALVAEPQLTSLEIAYNDLNILNIADEIIGEGEFVPQAALFVNPDSMNDEDVKLFLSKFEENINYLNSNPVEYATRVVNSKITYFSAYQTPVLSKALPRCNLSYKKGNDNKEIIEKFYDSCDRYINNMFGGVKPDEGFYNE